MTDLSDFLDREVFLERRGGTFVEAGAGDGKAESHTISLESERGWTGLLIEPNPVAFSFLRDTRPNTKHLNKALWKESDFVKFKAPSKATIEVEATTLNEALAEMPKEIDLLILDIDGAEWEVLKVYDWTAHEIEVIAVNDPSGHLPLRQRLTDKGYRYLRRVGQIDVYRLPTASG